MFLVSERKKFRVFAHAWKGQLSGAFGITLQVGSAVTDSMEFAATLDDEQRM